MTRVKQNVCLQITITILDYDEKLKRTSEKNID